jgi:hypothetical protein
MYGQFSKFIRRNAVRVEVPLPLPSSLSPFLPTCLPPSLSFSPTFDPLSVLPSLFLPLYPSILLPSSLSLPPYLCLCLSLSFSSIFLPLSASFPLYLCLSLSSLSSFPCLCISPFLPIYLLLLVSFLLTHTHSLSLLCLQSVSLAEDEQVAHIAFVNAPSGVSAGLENSRVMVVTNEHTIEQPVQIQWQGKFLSVSLPPASVSTFVWFAEE